MLVKTFGQEKRAQRLIFLGPSKVCLPWVSKRGIWDVPRILPGCPRPLGVFKNFVQKKVSRKKSQHKEEVFGTDIPRTSGGHSRGYPGPKFRSGDLKSWKKNQHLGADIHDPKARTSTTPRDFRKLRSEKLWVECSLSLKFVRISRSKTWRTQADDQGLVPCTS